MNVKTVINTYNSLAVPTADMPGKATVKVTFFFPFYQMFVIFKVSFKRYIEKAMSSAYFNRLHLNCRLVLISKPLTIDTL